MKMVWKDVPSFEGFYMVSKCGKVKRLPRYDRAKKGRQYQDEIELKSFEKVSGSGKFYVVLNDGDRAKFYSIEKLVKDVFEGVKRFSGVVRKGNNWHAQGYRKGRYVWIGSYDSEAKAIEARKKFDEKKEREQEEQKRLKQAREVRQRENELRRAQDNLNYGRLLG